MAHLRRLALLAALAFVVLTCGYMLYRRVAWMYANGFVPGPSPRNVGCP